MVHLSRPAHRPPGERFTEASDRWMSATRNVIAWRRCCDLRRAGSDVPLLDDAGIARCCRSRPRIALVGASAPRPGRLTGCCADLRRTATTSSPVNPREAEIDGPAVLPERGGCGRGDRARSTSSTCSAGRTCASSTPREAVAVGARCLWLQLGIANEEAGRDRARCRAGGGHGPLHDRRAPAPRAADGRLAPASARTAPPSPIGAHPEDRDAPDPPPRRARRLRAGRPPARRPQPGDPDRGPLRRRPRGQRAWSRPTAACSGYTGTVDGVPVSVQTTMMGAPTTSIVVEELLMLGVHDVHPRRHHRRLRADRDRRRRRRDGGGRPTRASATSSAAARRPPRRPTSTSSSRSREAARARGPDDPRRADRHRRRVLRPDARRRGPLGPPRATCRPRWRPRPCSCSRCASGQGPAGPGGLHPDGVGRDLRPGRRTRPARAAGDLVPAARGRGHPARRPDDRRGARGRRGARPGVVAAARLSLRQGSLRPAYEVGPNRPRRVRFPAPRYGACRTRSREARFIRRRYEAGGAFDRRGLATSNSYLGRNGRRGRRRWRSDSGDEGEAEREVLEEVVDVLAAHRDADQAAAASAAGRRA